MSTDVVLQLKLADVTGCERMTQMEELRLELRTWKDDVSKQELLQQRVMNEHVLRLYTAVG